MNDSPKRRITVDCGADNIDTVGIPERDMNCVFVPTDAIFIFPGNRYNLKKISEAIQGIHTKVDEINSEILIRKCRTQYVYEYIQGPPQILESVEFSSF